MQKFRGKWQKLYIKDLIYGRTFSLDFPPHLLHDAGDNSHPCDTLTHITTLALILIQEQTHAWWWPAAFSTPVNSHPVIMPWSFSSSLPHHPVINFSENSLRQGPLIYYVYIPARVYRNFDKENFKNISLLKSLKRNFFEKKFVQVELV